MTGKEETVFSHLDQLRMFLVDTRTQKVSYNERLLDQVSVHLFESHRQVPVYALLQILDDKQKVDKRATSQLLLAYAFCSHFGVDNLDGRLHQRIHKHSKSFTPIALPPTQEHGGWKLVSLLRHFCITPNSGMVNEVVTVDQLNLTCSTALFTLAKVTRTRNHENTINHYANELIKVTEQVNPTLFVFLVKRLIWHIDYSFLQPGSPLLASLALAGKLLHSCDDSRFVMQPRLAKIASIVLEGYNVDSFLTYHLIREIADTDGIVIDQLVEQCAAVSQRWSRLSKILAQRREELEEAPVSYYQLSPLLLPKMKLEFSLDNNPVVIATCFSILKRIRRNSAGLLDKVMFSLYPEEREEADRAFRSYMDLRI